VKNKPELLSPAGSPLALRRAVAYGADAVYAGVPRWSLRVRGNGFTKDDFADGIRYAHEHGRRFYAVVNAIPHERRLRAGFRDSLSEVAALHPDALIMADPGLIAQALEICPQIPVHLSVQANTVNSGDVRFWARAGVKRCILARELSLSEISLIREECPDTELEVFAHGALCIAVSGRCLISGLLSRRDANTGACNNSCRHLCRVRAIRSVQAGSAGDLPDDEVLCAQIEDAEKRPGEWMDMEEDAHGTYLMNSKDLCTLPILDRLCATGVDSIKIEGRSRSPFYVAAITRAYRLALDAVARGEAVPEESFTIASSIPSREYTTALLEPGRPDRMQDYETNTPSPGRMRVCGQILSQDPDGTIHVQVKNRFGGGRVSLLTPDGFVDLDVSDMIDEKTGERVEVARGSGYFVRLKCPCRVDLEMDEMVAWEDGA
jgi:putative protease